MDFKSGLAAGRHCSNGPVRFNDRRAFVAHHHSFKLDGGQAEIGGSRPGI
jgi:hypothetical protein